MDGWILSYLNFTLVFAFYAAFASSPLHFHKYCGVDLNTFHRHSFTSYITETYNDMIKYDSLKKVTLPNTVIYSLN